MNLRCATKCWWLPFKCVLFPLTASPQHPEHSNLVLLGRAWDTGPRNPKSRGGGVAGQRLFLVCPWRDRDKQDCSVDFQVVQLLQAPHTSARLGHLGVSSWVAVCRPLQLIYEMGSHRQCPKIKATPRGPASLGGPTPRRPRRRAQARPVPAGVAAALGSRTASASSVFASPLCSPSPLPSPPPARWLSR